MAECPPGVHSIFDPCPGDCTDLAEDECMDESGEIYPEHNFNETECRRCGAEPED
ncbi:hypothetical protein [Streptomyces cinereoruber]|uniref:hypothetical protein n=1 Tax=Streptomyces cinereoruber TaxID=67260 RepID=UPI003C2B1819